MTDDVRNIRIEDYDYPLTDDRIALHPLEDRDKCRLLHWCAGSGISDRVFCELPDLLPADSVLVYNNTRVINARLRFRKGETDEGALIEVFCLEPVTPADYARNFESTHSCSWTCLVGNSKKWKPGLDLTRHLVINGETVVLTARRDTMASPTVVVFEWDNASLTFSDIISAAGEIPIPPYLNRSSEESDNRDYQTVFSRIEGSVAAPTAGLHFTSGLLEEIDRRGVLEAVLNNMEGDTLVADTRLIIAPGYRYNIVDGMVTNFHQPKSTLLLLVSAFIAQAGGDGCEWRRLYDHALADPSYRFLSYGDACLLLKN